ALLAGSWCVLFFTLSGCKLPTYILPAYPLLALALGACLDAGRWARSRWLGVVGGAAFVMLCVGHYVVVPWYAWYRSPVRQLDVLAGSCGDRAPPVLCYPRTCDSVAFSLGRDDLRCYRSKQIDPLRMALQSRPRTLVLLTHRHSLLGLRQFLPPEVSLVEERHFGLPRVPGLPDSLGQRLAGWLGETALNLCDLAVIERRTPAPLPEALPLRSGPLTK